MKGNGFQEMARTAAVPTQDEGSVQETLKKANDTIGLRVSRGRLSFLSRKLFNVFVAHAQRLGAPGINAPITTPTSSQYFWVPYAEVVRDASYESNDNDFLKEVVGELQDVRIICETDREWTSEQLVASVKIVKTSGTLHKRGGRLWIAYTFPPEVMAAVMNPSRFTKMSLYYHTVLKTGAALALYEAARSVLWRTPAITVRKPWQAWRDELEGVPGAELPDWKQQYKFVKNRLFKPSVIEVNSVTDIEVELVEYKSGRSVTDLEFRVFRKAQTNLEFPVPPVLNGGLLARLSKLGLSAREAGEICGKYDEGYIDRTITLVHQRMQRTDLATLKSPAGFLKTALTGRYIEVGEAVDLAPIALPSPPPLLPRARVEIALPVSAVGQEMRDSLRQQINDLDEEERYSLIQQFQAQANPQIRKALARGGLKSKIVEAAFLSWMATAPRTTFQ